MIPLLLLIIYVSSCVVCLLQSYYEVFIKKRRTTLLDIFSYCIVSIIPVFNTIGLAWIFIYWSDTVVFNKG